jgi:hypothetical protein
MGRGAGGGGQESARKYDQRGDLVGEDEVEERQRIGRGGAFNTLDAVNRLTRAASEALAREAPQLVTVAVESVADRSSEERDARFDPDDDQANYPDTWLR